MCVPSQLKSLAAATTGSGRYRETVTVSSLDDHQNARGEYTTQPTSTNDGAQLVDSLTPKRCKAYRSCAGVKEKRL